MKSFHIIRKEKQPRRCLYMRNKKNDKWKFSCRNSIKDDKISNLNVRNLLQFFFLAWLLTLSAKLNGSIHMNEKSFFLIRNSQVVINEWNGMV